MRLPKPGLLALIFCSLVMQSAAAQAAAPRQTFNQWIEGVRAEAKDAGIGAGTVDRALASAQFLPRVIELDRSQPERRLSFAQYRQNIVNPERLAQGRALMRAHRAALQEAEDTYGVPAPFIVALWGVETNYGKITGNYGIVSALATLAYEGRRRDFFRAELIEALRILDQNHIALEKMRGSWAGAMGQNQFMPSSFMKFAVDGDGDGRKDIWGNLADVFASSANYLAQNGWQAGQGWGVEVELPAGFDRALLTDKLKDAVWKRPHEWADYGVVPAQAGAALSDIGGDRARTMLVAPDGAGGPVFLVGENYRTLMRWNSSFYFATSVSLIADALARDSSAPVLTTVNQ